MIQGFKNFLMRGNVIDLAVAVVIGTAFTALVSAVIESIFNPVIGAIFNAESLNETFIVQIPLLTGTADLKFGAVIAVLIQFILTAAVVYMAFVAPLNALHKKREAQRKANGAFPDEDVPATEQELLEEIRDLLKAQAENK